MSFRIVSGKPSISRPVRYGFAMFAIAMVVGIAATHFTVQELSVPLPAETELDAMRRGSRADGYTLIGWGATFVLAVVLGVAVGRRESRSAAAKEKHARPT